MSVSRILLLTQSQLPGAMAQSRSLVAGDELASQLATPFSPLSNDRVSVADVPESP